MTALDYLLIGHITADRIPTGRRLGGTVSYAAPVARRFGQRVGIFTSAALDEPLLRPLLDEASLMVCAAHETTTFENTYTDVGRVQHVYHRAAHLTPALLPSGWRDTPLVHLAPLIGEVDPDFAALFPQSLVLLTPQGFMRRKDATGRVHFEPFVDEAILRAVNILVLSKQDIAEAPELEAFYPRFTEHVIVTDGDHGGTYYHHGQAYPYVPYPVKEVDPTGAGDVFATALLSSLPRVGYDMHKALRVAARLAAFAVTVVGAGCPATTEDIQVILHEVRQNP